MGFADQRKTLSFSGLNSVARDVVEPGPATSARVRRLSLCSADAAKERSPVGMPSKAAGAAGGAAIAALKQLLDRAKTTKTTAKSRRAANGNAESALEKDVKAAFARIADLLSADFLDNLSSASDVLVSLRKLVSVFSRVPSLAEKIAETVADILDRVNISILRAKAGHIASLNEIVEKSVSLVEVMIQDGYLGNDDASKRSLQCLVRLILNGNRYYMKNRRRAMDVIGLVSEAEPSKRLLVQTPSLHKSVHRLRDIGDYCLQAEFFDVLRTAALAADDEERDGFLANAFRGEESFLKDFLEIVQRPHADVRQLLLSFNAEANGIDKCPRSLEVSSLECNNIQAAAGQEQKLWLDLNVDSLSFTTVARIDDAQDEAVVSVILPFSEIKSWSFEKADEDVVRLIVKSEAVKGRGTESKTSTITARGTMGRDLYQTVTAAFKRKEVAGFVKGAPIEAISKAEEPHAPRTRSAKKSIAEHRILVKPASKPTENDSIEDDFSHHESAGQFETRPAGDREKSQRAVEARTREELDSLMEPPQDEAAPEQHEAKAVDDAVAKRRHPARSKKRKHASDAEDDEAVAAKEPPRKAARRKNQTKEDRELRTTPRRKNQTKEDRELDSTSRSKKQAKEDQELEATPRRKDETKERRELDEPSRRKKQTNEDRELSAAPQDHHGAGQSLAADALFVPASVPGPRSTRRVEEGANALQRDVDLPENTVSEGDDAADASKDVHDGHGNLHVGPLEGGNEENMVASQDRSGNNSPSSSLWLPRKVEHAGIEEADDDDVMGFISPTLESMKGNQSAQVVAAAMLEFADLGTGRRGRVSSALMLPAAPAQLLPSLLDSRFDQQKIHQGSLESHVLDGLLGALSEAASDGVKSTSFRGNHTRNTAQIEELDNDQDMDNRGADITLIDLRVEAPRARRPNLAAPPVAEEPTSNTDGDDGIVALFMQLGELVSRRLNAKDAEARLMFEDAASEVDQTLKAMLTSTLKSRMQSINGYATEMERAYESLASGLGRK